MFKCLTEPYLPSTVLNVIEKKSVWKLRWIDIGWYVSLDCLSHSPNAVVQINIQRDGVFSMPKGKCVLLLHHQKIL
jgi:hypothetical protein